MGPQFLVKASITLSLRIPSPAISTVALVGPEGYNAVDNNTIYHNDFINNYQNVLVSSPDSVEINDGSASFVNFWYNGFEGNYSNKRYAKKISHCIGNKRFGNNELALRD